jgi:hypothetical protein
MRPDEINFLAPPGHLQAIGLVAASWSKLEWLVEELIWQLAGIMDSLWGRAITSDLGIRARFDALLSLADVRIPDTEEEKKLQALQKRIVSGVGGKPSLSSLRNKVIHAYWSDLDGPRAFATNVSARGKLKFDIRPMEESEIRGIAEAIFLTVIELDRIQNELRAAGFRDPPLP